MKNLFPIFLIAATLIFAAIACKKNGTSNNAVTVESIAGTYGLHSLLWNYSGTLVNVYDSLDACEKDNLISFNTDKTLDFTDAGIICNPPEDGNGTWDLKGDSLIFSSSFTSSKIESFDGKTLVLTGVPQGTTGVTATTTLVKQ